MIKKRADKICTAFKTNKTQFNKMLRQDRLNTLWTKTAIFCYILTDYHNNLLPQINPKHAFKIHVLYLISISLKNWGSFCHKVVDGLASCCSSVFIFDSPRHEYDEWKLIVLQRKLIDQAILWQIVNVILNLPWMVNAGTTLAFFVLYP